MSKTIKTAAISVLVLSAILCGYLFYTKASVNEKIVYMDNVKVFEAFQMKKDYDLLIEKELKIQSAELDSLATQISLYAQKGDTQYALSLKKNYVFKKQSFDQKFNQLSQKYTREVYEKLNAHIKEFARSGSYDFILGANGEGNIMFVSDELDVSDELITYINSQYNK